MIIRETDAEFILTEQHEHALISEYLFKYFKTEALPSDDSLASVQYAIKMHDVGWVPFDAEPFWENKNNTPHSFISFPNAAKTVLYKHGIDEVEKVDPYAAILCSKHYSRFMERDSTTLVQKFLNEENKRQEKLIHNHELNTEQMDFHFQLLQLFDNLSLFLCLNAPGTKKEDIHYFFKKGIVIPTNLRKEWGERFDLNWTDNENLICTPYPFKEALQVTIPQKRIAKKQIEESGLQSSYSEAIEEKVTLNIKASS